MFFERLILIANKSRLRHWTLKRCFKFQKRRELSRRWTLKRSQVMFNEKRRESLRCWTLKRSQEIFDEMKKFMS